jgi:hypothetical protein
MERATLVEQKINSYNIFLGNHETNWRRSESNIKIELRSGMRIARIFRK